MKLIFEVNALERIEFFGQAGVFLFLGLQFGLQALHFLNKRLQFGQTREPGQFRLGFFQRGLCRVAFGDGPLAPVVDAHAGAQAFVEEGFEALGLAEAFFEREEARDRDAKDAL